MKTKLFLSLCLLIYSSALFAQRKMTQMDSDKQQQEDEAKDYERKPWRDKVSFGGNIWAQFGSYDGGSYSMFLLQPMVFYKFTDKSIGGAGITYMYMNQTEQYGNMKYEFSDNIYGFDLIFRQLIIGPAFVQAEYAPLNFTAMNSRGNTKRMWANSLLLGGGIAQEMGTNGVAYASIMYDVMWKQFTYDPTNPDQYNTTIYGSPWRFNIGFMF
jgi:hypothetical protein